MRRLRIVLLLAVLSGLAGGLAAPASAGGSRSSASRERPVVAFGMRW